MTTLDHVSSAVKAASLNPERREEDYKRCLRRLAASGEILEICRKAFEDPCFMKELAGRSFYHPTGVSKIVITDSSESEPELRIHFWPPIAGAKGNELSIHDHRWDFASLVIGGELHHEVFSPDSDGLPYHAVEFQKVAGNKVYNVKKLGIQSLVCSGNTSILTGQDYFLQSSTLHRMINKTLKTAVTLFLRSPYLSNETLVCHEDANAIVAGTYPQRMDVSTAARLLRLLGGGILGDGSANEWKDGALGRERDRALQGDRRERAPL